MIDAKRLYDDDFIAWSKQQAEALRAAARGGSNQAIDWENVAEEIEDLGKSQRRELSSRIREIILHLVKLTNSPRSEPRPGWRSSIRRQRAEIEDLLKDNPSLGREVAAMIREQIPRAVRAAIDDLADRGELHNVARQDLKDGPSPLFAEEQVLGDWFPPEPEAPRG
jgi:hypothetical protein